MKKALFFPHDFGARNDPKLLRLRRILGAEGKGLYWDIIENLFEQGGTLSWEDAAEVAYFNQVEEEKVLSVIKDFGLFEYDDSGFWSSSQKRRQKQIDDITEARRRGGRARAQLQAQQAQEQQNFSSAAAQQEDNNSTATADAQQRNKEIKKEINKEKDLDISVDISSSSDAVGQPTLFPQEKDGEAGNKLLTKEQCRGILKLWNDTVAKHSATFSRVQSLTDDRYNKILIRWKEFKAIGPPEEVVKKVFDNACLSTFLQGGKQGGWKADFDWLFRNGTNWLKTLEGSYTDETISNRRTARRNQIDIVDTGESDIYDGRF